MDTNVIYGDHLQIVKDREAHERLKAVQLIMYPKSIIVTPAVLQLYHADDHTQYLDQIKYSSPNAVWYILPEGDCGAGKGYHCNGIRYGSEGSEYVSLTRIKSITGE